MARPSVLIGSLAVLFLAGCLYVPPEPMSFFEAEHEAHRLAAHRLGVEAPHLVAAYTLEARDPDAVDRQGPHSTYTMIMQRLARYPDADTGDGRGPLWAFFYARPDDDATLLAFTQPVLERAHRPIAAEREVVEGALRASGTAAQPAIDSTEAVELARTVTAWAERAAEPGAIFLSVLARGAAGAPEWRLVVARPAGPDGLLVRVDATDGTLHPDTPEPWPEAAARLVHTAAEPVRLPGAEETFVWEVPDRGWRRALLTFESSSGAGQTELVLTGPGGFQRTLNPGARAEWDAPEPGTYTGRIAWPLGGVETEHEAALCLAPPAEPYAWRHRPCV